MKMLWVYLTIAVFLISGTRAQDEKVAEINEKTLKEFTKNRCIKYNNVEAFDDLNEALEDYFHCLSRKPHPEGEPSNDEELFAIICEVYPQAAYSCVENIVDALEYCLNPKEMYFSKFVLGTFNSSFEEFCQGGVSGLKERVAAYEAAKCIVPPFTLRALGEVCLPKMSLWKQRSNPDYVLTEADFCSDIDKGYDCVISNLEKVCEEDIITSVVKPRLEPFVNWCNERRLENIIDLTKKQIDLLIN